MIKNKTILKLSLCAIMLSYNNSEIKALSMNDITTYLKTHKKRLATIAAIGTTAYFANRYVQKTFSSPSGSYFPMGGWQGLFCTIVMLASGCGRMH